MPLVKILCVFQLYQTLSFDSRFIIALEEYNTLVTSLLIVRFGHRDTGVIREGVI